MFSWLRRMMARRAVPAAQVVVTPAAAELQALLAVMQGLAAAPTRQALRRARRRLHSAPVPVPAVHLRLLELVLAGRRAQLRAQARLARERSRSPRSSSSRARTARSITPPPR